jgi:hypothetical protein
MTRPLDLAGQRFGRLLVMARGQSTPRGDATWRCRCDCGTTVAAVMSHSLASGNSTSCGCYRRDRTIEVKTRHGLGSRSAQHPLRQTWKSMLTRCTNPRSRSYRNYGGRGIAVCERWSDLAAFVADIETAIGPRPAGHTLDRIDNDRNYEPGNLRWATPREQARNQRPRSRRPQ